MKKILILLVVFTLSITGCAEKTSVELVEQLETIEDLVEQAPVILEVKIAKNPDSVEYKGQNYYLSNTKIKTILRDIDGNLENEKEILLFQNEFIDIDPLVKKGKEYLVFLTPMEFPGYENVYRAIGLYNGKFNIENGKYKNSKFSGEKKEFNEVDLKLVIETVKYNSESGNKKSKEELDAEEKNERAEEEKYEVEKNK